METVGVETDGVETDGVETDGTVGVGKSIIAQIKFWFIWFNRLCTNAFGKLSVGLFELLTSKQ